MSLQITPADHIIGNELASIELLEYGDYECPYCGQAYYIVKDIQEKFKSNLKFIFRNFPLPQLHPHAIHAAVAAEVAGSQNKFWEMHDMLFENHKNLKDEDLVNYEGKIGCNEQRFIEDFDKDQYFNKVQKDYKSGVNNGVRGTPTFFVNGKIFEGNWMDREFIDYLESLTY